VLHPFDQKTGWDYNSVFVDDMSYHEGHGEAYKNYGVDRERGCVAITRPDQYVGFIGELDEEGVEGVERFFQGVFIT
jgi:phenol 2-monooxygenase